MALHRDDEDIMQSMSSRHRSKPESHTLRDVLRRDILDGRGVILVIEVMSQLQILSAVLTPIVLETSAGVPR